MHPGLLHGRGARDTNGAAVTSSALACGSGFEPGSRTPITWFRATRPTSWTNSKYGLQWGPRELNPAGLATVGLQATPVTGPVKNPFVLAGRNEKTARGFPGAAPRTRHLRAKSLEASPGGYRADRSGAWRRRSPGGRQSRRPLSGPPWTTRDKTRACPDSTALRRYGVWWSRHGLLFCVPGLGPSEVSRI